MRDAVKPRSFRPVAGLGALLRAFAPLLAVAALVAVLALWLDDKKLTLDYLRTLVWPLVLAVVLWWLREPLRAKLADLLEVSAAGATARFAQQEAAANRELEGDLEEASRVLVGDTLQPAPVDEDEPEAPAPASDVIVKGEPALVTATALPGSVSTSPPADEPREPTPSQRKREARREIERRRAMEQVIRESAAWGYDMAGIGFKSRPVPVILWDEEGRPRIQYARGETPDELARRAEVAQRNRAVHADARPPEAEPEPSNFEKARRLEREIQKLEEERDSPFKMSLVGTRAVTIATTLDRMRKKLAQLDPNSPWL